VSTHKSEQRRVVLRGREFHFVSYESTPANEKKGEIAVPAMWYLMNEGHRRQVMPHTTGQDVIALDRALGRWVEEHIFSRALADV
jgi:hypothetical protein